MTFDQSVTRALLAGIAAFLIAWMAAVIVWRQLVVAEIEAFRQRADRGGRGGGGRRVTERSPEPSFS